MEKSCFFPFLCKRKRRIHLIIHWHTTGSFAYFEEFIETMLYAPILVLLENDSFTLFRNLRIQYSWLTAQEREFILQLKTPYSFTLSNQHRREIVRDLLILGFTRPDLSSLFALLISRTIQRMMLKHPDDTFLKSIYFVCQGVISLEDLLCS